MLPLRLSAKTAAAQNNGVEAGGSKRERNTERVRVRERERERQTLYRESTVGMREGSLQITINSAAQPPGSGAVPNSSASPVSVAPLRGFPGLI